MKRKNMCSLEAKLCALVLKNNLLKKIVFFLDKRLSSDALKAGYYSSTIKKQCVLLVTSLILLIPSFALLLIAILNSLFFLIVLSFILPLMPQAIFYAYLKNLMAKRSNGLRKELPYFTLYIATLQSAGIPLHMSLYKVARSNIFKSIKKEAMVFLRDVRLLGKDPLSALDALAKNSPYKQFQDLLYGYTSIYKSGGDLVRYLHEKVKDCFKELRFQWKMFVERSMDLGESLTTFFTVSILIILLASLILSEGFVPMIILLNFIILPVAFILSLMLIESIIPENVFYISILKKHILLSLALSLTFFVIANYVMNDYLLAIVAAFSTFALSYGIMYKLKEKTLRDIESGLPKLLRDITEFRKLGFTPAQAIVRLVTFRKYNKNLDKYLNKVAMNIRAGLGFRELPKTGSWLFDYTMFILREIEESGGGTPAILENLTQHVSDVMQFRREARSSLRLYEILAYITPLILIFSLFLTLKLISLLSFSEIALLLSSLGITLEKSIISMLKITIIEASLILSLLTSKIIDLTLKNTLRASIVLLVSLISFLIVPSIVDMLVKAAI